MKDGKLRVLVCGSTFGQFYLEALRLASDRFEPVGLLAKGSERSQRCAAYYGIKLYTDANELPADIDLACVVLRSGVLGGRGTELSLSLLERGIHVVQEQPVHHADLAACLRKARQKGVIFQTGDLYVHLPAVRRFIACAKAMLDRQKAVYIDAAFASQVSYPMVHIFAKALPAIRPWRIERSADSAGPFRVLTGTIGHTPVVMTVHHEVDPDDPDNYLHLLHRMTIGSAGGNLSLTDTHGPVVWRPRLHIPDHPDVLGKLASDHPAYLLDSSTETLGPASAASYKDILTAQWPRAIADDLSAMRERILGRVNSDMIAQQELTCSVQWQELTSALGYPELRAGSGHQPFPLRILRDAAAGIRDDGAAELRESGVVHAAAALEDVEVDIASCGEYAESELRGIDAASVNNFVAKLDEAVLDSMLYTLQQQGTLLDCERFYDREEAIAASRTSPKHRGLLGRWLELLAERGRVKRRNLEISGANTVTQAELDERWQAVREIWDDRLGSPLVMDYLSDNVRQLPRLISGEQQAAFLLFPEGRMEYARALYRETIIARYLNKSVAEAVVRIAAAKRGALADKSRRKLRIVEIGAGTGATTEAVIPRLMELHGAWDTEYRFTDVSPFFFADAKARFKHCPWMQFQVVDIDKDPVGQGLSAEGADIVIAAGVLNNATDTDRTVAGLMRLLAPGGWMLITEPVREFPEILISQAFMMTQPEDDRRNTGTAFLSAEQWRKVFAKAGATEIKVLPAEGHRLAPLGQKLFAVRKHG